MSSAGRKKDPVWIDFIELPNVLRQKTGSRAQCKNCGKEMQGLVSRLKDHKNNCRPTENLGNSSSASRDECETQTQDLQIASSSAGEQQEASRPNPRKRTKTAPLSGFITTTSDNLKNKIDKQVAKAIFATNCSFRSIENTQVLKTFELLRPGYKPPSEKNIAGRLLDEVYAEEKADCFSKLYGKTVCMSIDGWSNVHNEPIICACIITEASEVYLLNTIDTSGKPHTSDYLTNLANDSISDAKTSYNIKVASFVTDNAANMARMRENLRTAENEESIITYGCAAHILNLLAKDLSVRDVKEHVVRVIKYFRNNHFAAAKYKEEGGKMLVLPQDVRWNTLTDCLESYVNEWPKLLKICEENREKMDSQIIQKVNNVMIKRSAEDMLQILKPVAIGLDKLQRNSSTLSDTVECFKELEEKFPEGNASLAQISMLKSRTNQALTPAHYLTYLLDPRKNKYRLTNQEYESALKFAQESYPNSGLLPLIIKLEAKSDPFPNILFEAEILKNVKPLDWWKSIIRRENLDNGLVSILEQLFTATSSSAAIERIFSSFGVVHSKLRNRLGIEKASKLVFLFKYYNK